MTAAFAETSAALRRAIDTWPAGEPGLGQAMARCADATWMSGDSDGALELALRAQTLVAELAGDSADDIQLAVELDVAVGRYAWDVGDRVWLRLLDNDCVLTGTVRSWRSRARSTRRLVPRRWIINGIPSSGSGARSSTPAPTPAASLVTLHIYEDP